MSSNDIDFQFADVPAPIKSSILEKLDLIAGLVGDKETIMFVTSTHWAQIAAEVRRCYDKNPTPETFKELRLRKLRVVNAGTEDQQAVNYANQAAARDADFCGRRDRLVARTRAEAMAKAEYDRQFPSVAIGME